MHQKCLGATVFAIALVLCACSESTTSPVVEPASSLEAGPIAAPSLVKSSAASGFSDSFSSLSSSRWTKSTYHFDEMFSGAFFRAGNVSVSGGQLQLTLPAKSFDGGQIETVAKYGFGSYAATMQCPNVTKAYCTIFSYDGPSKDEIDIEIYQDGKWYVEFTAYERGRRECTRKITPSFDPSAGMHTYRYDYRSGAIRFYIDGKEQSTAACKVSLLPFGHAVPTSQMTFLLAAWWPSWMHGSKPSNATKMYVDAASYTP